MLAIYRLRTVLKSGLLVKYVTADKIPVGILCGVASLHATRLLEKDKII